MTVAAILQSATGIATHDAEYLLAFVLGVDRAWLIAHDDAAVATEQHQAFLAVLEHRRQGEPLAYCIAQREFYGRTFAVTPAVLIPRPSTEALIEATLAYCLQPQDAVQAADTAVVIVSRVLKLAPTPRLITDIGTGSGCIAITLACELPDHQLIATDLSCEALHIAQKNALTHGVDHRIQQYQGDLLAPLGAITEPFLVVSNPPYVPLLQPPDHSVSDFEPALALFGGADGGEIVRRLWRDCQAHPFCQGLIIECRSHHIPYLQ
jgi:release factor glutamine methyltransferase